MFSFNKILLAAALVSSVAMAGCSTTAGVTAIPGNIATDATNAVQTILTDVTPTVSTNAADVIAKIQAGVATGCGFELASSSLISLATNLNPIASAIKGVVDDVCTVVKSTGAKTGGARGYYGRVRGVPIRGRFAQ